jgi:hypothetical protein
MPEPRDIYLDPAPNFSISFKMPLVDAVDYGFIKSTFFAATTREDFQNKWMSSDTRGKLTAKYCIANSALVFNGAQLHKCLSLWQNEHLQLQMDMRKDISTDHIGCLERF